MCSNKNKTYALERNLYESFFVFFLFRKQKNQSNQTRSLCMCEAGSSDRFHWLLSSSSVTIITWSKAKVFFQKRCEIKSVADHNQKCKVQTWSRFLFSVRERDLHFAFVFSHVSRSHNFCLRLFQLSLPLSSQQWLPSRLRTVFRSHARSLKTFPSTTILTRATAINIINAQSTAWCKSHVPKICISTAMSMYAVIPMRWIAKTECH